MASKKDNFYHSGPSHLVGLNWDDADHRKSVAASLVSGVYVQEKDRQKKREGPDSLARPWWTSFGFQLCETLVDGEDNSIFGAIYVFQPPTDNNTLPRSPCHVIAFRGTTIKRKSFVRDMKLDLKILKNGLHQDPRSKKATEAVRKMVQDSVGGNGSNIWLAGHSLGSSIALHAGKTMAKSGIFIESFLFNPPFPSAALYTMFKSEKTKQKVRIGASVVKAVLSSFINLGSSSYDSFCALSVWNPNLFVNPSDRICSEYVEYFKHRRQMEEIGAGRIERVATQNSFGSLMKNAFGKDAEPLHLIPSAILTVNWTTQQNGHGLDQWWKPKLDLESETHIFKYE